MTDSYRDFLRLCWRKNREERASFAGGISDTRLEQIITTIWNGALEVAE